MQTEPTETCSKCGYDLRGLPNGICPECGYEYVEKEDRNLVANFFMRLIDSNLAVKGLTALPDIHQEARKWMAIGGIIVVIVGFLQFLVAFGIIPIPLYLFVLLALSISWPFVTKGIMLDTVDSSMPPIYSQIRKRVPTTQWCWPIAYAFSLMIYFFTTKETIVSPIFSLPTLMLFIVAGIGMMGCTFWLHDLALRLELHASAWKCNAVTWMMGTWGFLVLVTPWQHASTPGYTDLTPALVWMFVVMLIFPWLFILSLLARSLFDISSHARWALKYEQDIEGRIDRVRAKRASLDRKYGLMDASVVLDEDCVCATCGYSLGGLSHGDACPECGEQAVSVVRKV